MAMTLRRTCIASVISPLIPVVYLVSVSYVLGGVEAGRRDIALVLIFALSVSYLGFLVGGLPLIYLLYRARFLNFCALLIGGALLGAVIWYLSNTAFVWLLTSTRDGSSLLPELFWGMAFGVSVALPFGLIAGVPLRCARRRCEA